MIGCDLPQAFGRPVMRVSVGERVTGFPFVFACASASATPPLQQHMRTQEEATRAYIALVQKIKAGEESLPSVPPGIYWGRCHRRPLESPVRRLAWAQL